MNVRNHQTDPDTTGYRRIMRTAHEKEQDWLTNREAAEMIGVSPFTTKAWRIKGKGPAYLRVAGKDVRYLREDVVNWMRTKDRLAIRRISTMDQV